MTKTTERSSTVSGADIRAVWYAMVEEAAAGLKNVRIIRLDDLGSLRITLSSEGKDALEEVTAAVKKIRVIFSPGRKCSITRSLPNCRKVSGCVDNFICAEILT